LRFGLHGATLHPRHARSGFDRMMGKDTMEVASPTCLADAAGPAPFDGDVQDSKAVALWRKGERDRLRALRLSLPVDGRRTIEAALARHLDALLAGRDLTGTIVSGYWPIKGEPDLRGWLAGLRDRGAIVALPVSQVPAQPLEFRPWAADATLERGHWNIPVPPASAGSVVPQITLAPLVGWDMQGYRLGYGGGYFDRTLAALFPRPMVIGIGFQAAQLPGILPQPHDIGMDVIVTEAGVQWGPHCLTP
jgi:5-formyltetrahydrofolate cyclo-ligase